MFDCSSGKRLLDLHRIHNTDSQTVDFHEDCIISGSRDRTIKVSMGINVLYQWELTCCTVELQWLEQAWNHENLF